MDSYISTKNNELKSLYNYHNIINDCINSFDFPKDGMEELELDELIFLRDGYRIKIDELEKLLKTVENTVKFKNELIHMSSTLPK